jgi:hypothetical protein
LVLEANYFRASWELWAAVPLLVQAFLALVLVQVLLVALVVYQWRVCQQALQVRVLWGLVALRLALPLRLQE